MKRFTRRRPGLRLGCAVLSVVFMAALATTSVQAAELVLLCASAMKVPVAALLAKREASSPRVAVTYATPGAIRERIAKGERPDLVIVPSEDTFALMKQGLLNVTTRRALGETEIGVVVRSGARVPDIHDTDALRSALLAAHKVVIVDPSKGLGGRLAEGLFRELHIENQMRDKIVRSDDADVVEAVARGKGDLGIQQVSEIRSVAGVRLVGPLPGDLQRLMRYDIAMLVASRQPKDAEALVRDLSSKEAHAVIEKNGFMPAR